VLATELHPHRARLLKSLNRLPNVAIVAADARQFPFKQGFKRILADVPCSGTGTLSHNPEIKWRLNKEDLQDLQSRQIAILNSALSQLSSDGTALYSTCSLETEENEMVVKAVLDARPEFAVVDLRKKLERLGQDGELSSELAGTNASSLLSGPYLRTIPGVNPYDGFFAAMIARDDRA
jgi:16S rRNA (cytosine967-C5)-methyltransferase